MSNSKVADEKMGYQSWNNMLKLHAATSDPTSPITGEIYLNTSTTMKLKRYDGSGWDVISYPVDSTTGNYAQGTTLYRSGDGAAGEGEIFDASNNITFNKTFTFGSFPIFTASDVTIASGVVTATTPLIFVDTESGAASDDLDTINGGTTNGQLLMVRTKNAARDVVLKDGTGNLKMHTGDVTLPNNWVHAFFIYDNTNSLWVNVAMLGGA
jgi:hypothetical protein